MPLVTMFGKQVRCRPVLDYIGAQESLSHHTRSVLRPTPNDLRTRNMLARRRNSCEGKLRPEEREAVKAYLVADEPLRQALWAMLTDPPTKEPSRG